MGPSARVSRISQTGNCRLDPKEKLDSDTVRFPCAFLVKRSWKGFSAPPCVSMDPTDTDDQQCLVSTIKGRFPGRFCVVFMKVKIPLALQGRHQHPGWANHIRASLL